MSDNDEARTESLRLKMEEFKNRRGSRRSELGSRLSEITGTVDNIGIKQHWEPTPGRHAVAKPEPKAKAKAAPEAAPETVEDAEEAGDLARTRPCLRFQHGTCFHGRGCPYKHLWCRAGDDCNHENCGFRHSWDAVWRCYEGRRCNNPGC